MHSDVRTLTRLDKPRPMVDINNFEIPLLHFEVHFQILEELIPLGNLHIRYFSPPAFCKLDGLGSVTEVAVFFSLVF